MSRETIKNYITNRFESYPGMPIPEGLVESALLYIPERLTGKFSVLYVQSPADRKRVSGDIETAIGEWNASKRCEATLTFIKVLLDTCI